MSYIPVIGLEVHVEMKTNSKMFCGCSTQYFGKPPNTHTCPICLGLPGALPVPNKKAIEWCVLTGLALNCTIPLASKFDRKNYFYPDLPKGYQISQYDQPFCNKGHLTLSNGKAIRIRRVHMEEDTGKLHHETVKDERVSLVDFNRSGMPLVEIVTEPDFENAQEVKEYLQKLQQIVRYIGVSTADMEKGEMRLEPNISLREMGKPLTSKNLPKYKVEVKNINSFSFVDRAIAYEIGRQTKILESGKLPPQETRGWDEDKKATFSQRSKEDAAEYRYFPEPDIPPIIWTQKEINAFRDILPELPDEKKSRFVKVYGLSEYSAEILTRTRDLADYFEKTVKISKKLSATTIANWIINKKINIDDTLPAVLIQQIVQTQQVDQISEQELEKIAKEILAKNEKSVTDYKAGKTNAIMYLVGQTMKALQGKAKAETVRQVLEKLLY